MRFKNYLPLLVIAGCLCPSLFWAQNYRVKAPHVDKVSISEETNPPARTYAIIDLGTDLEPVRVTNSGYVLCTDGAVTKRWYQGELEDLTGGDDEETVAGYDINEQGTVVGDVHLDSARYPAPACGYAGQYTPWFAEYNYGTGGAVRWDAGQTEASLLGGAFASGFTIQTGPDVAPYTGAVSGSSAMTIDDSGHIYGVSLLAYQELPAYSEQDGTFHVTHWGSYSSGYDFTSGTGLGTQSLAQDADGFHVLGKVYQIDKARGGATFGSGDGNYYMNDQLVDFRPLNLNSHGLALGSIRDPGYNDFQPYERYYIIGPGPGTRTDLKVSRPRFLGSADYPAALNYRTISLTDSEGQVTTKVSPQVVGSRGTFWGSDGAAIWEEDSKSGQYQMQYLNQLLPSDSGWNLQYANDINDDGLIAAEGWYQAKDQDGNPAGDPQWKACLLVPIKTVYAFFGASDVSDNEIDPGDPYPDANLSLLNKYLHEEGPKFDASPDILNVLKAFDGQHPGAECSFMKSSAPGSPIVRVFTYNCIRANRAAGAVAMQAMKNALATDGAYVTFNGHANMGAGPAFTLDVGGLSGFMHVSNSDPLKPAAVSAAVLQEEHYSFVFRPYVPGNPDNEIVESGKNYTVKIVDKPRFPDIPPNATLYVQGSGSTAYHFEADIRTEPEDPAQVRKFTLVRGSSSDLPVLRYKWFFFDACNSGRDYIEVFEHGTFFYTNTLSGDLDTTKVFVEAIVEDKQLTDTVRDLNSLYDNAPVNAVHEFDP
jgi:hypothetical protein